MTWTELLLKIILTSSRCYYYLRTIYKNPNLTPKRSEWKRVTGRSDTGRSSGASPGLVSTARYPYTAKSDVSTSSAASLGLVSN